jgi:class 3 adenylate cyclase/TolB-like protein
MPTSEPSPLQLTIRRQGDTHVVDLAAGGPLIQSETLAAASLLRELATQFTSLATLHGMGEGRGGQVLSDKPDAVVHRLEQIGNLIFSQLLPQNVRQRLLTTSSSNFYLHLDEQLIHIPWELCYDGNEFLATKFYIGRQVITNAAVPERRLSRTETGPLKVLLIADPTEDLPQAADEGEQLCQLLDQVPGVRVKLLAGRFASKTHILLELQAHDVVHFAGHSHYDPEHPQKSGWHLYGEMLTAEELSTLRNPPLLVFSNSCQAGATPAWGGRYQYDGQAFGIGSAFLLAGVTNYIGTFWVVHDQESRVFAVAFYQGIAEGRSVGEALQQARLRVRQEIKQQKGWEGLTWASYMLYGDPRATLLPQLPPTKEVKRELVAIFSADAEGYSHHVSVDDIATMQTLNAYRQVMAALIAKQHGMVVDMAGDNLLASFLSVMEAVQCAVEIQRELKVRNAELPAQRQLQFRIGIHLGDVIRQETGISGDAVNIAARLQKLAPRGGICISGSAYEQVKNRLHSLNIGYQYLGKQKLHNIPQPVVAYQVLLEPVPHSFRFFSPPRSLPRYIPSQRSVLGVVIALGLVAVFIWLPLPSKTVAVVVMPFEVPEPNRQLGNKAIGILPYFNSQLSKASGLKVYSREHFDFEVRKRNLPVIDVAKQLGIAKMIYGSVLLFGSKLHIEAHINDVQSGEIEASEIVEGEVDDLLNLTKKIVAKLMGRLHVAAPVEQAGLTPASPSPNLDAYNRLLEAEGEKPILKAPQQGGGSSQNVPRTESEPQSWAPQWHEWLAVSTALADETSSSEATPEQEVRQVLETYSQAYQQKNLDLLATVYQTFTPAQQEANAKYFQNTQDLRVTISNVDISIQGNEAAVSYTREDEFTDANTKQKVKLDARFTKMFVRTDQGWKMIIGKQ